jgi:EAL domain-containing protein (putative c-di-GMP-specific phosphodiesterase class I)/GGDEF domain-containing protein
VLFVAGLLIVTGSLASAAVVAGVNRQAIKSQEGAAQRIVGYVATDAARLLAAGDAGALDRMIDMFAKQPHIRGAQIFAQGGAVIATRGHVNLRAGALAAEAIAAGQPRTRRFSDGAVAAAYPLPEGAVRGAALVEVDPRSFLITTSEALAPFLIFLLMLLAVVLPISVLLIRRTIAPLGELARFAESLAAGGEAKPIIMRTGDEFETLARAFNHMIERHTASLRRIQQIAFVDPVTQLPNLDRLQRDLDFFILRADAQKDVGGVFIFDFEGFARLMHTLAPGVRRGLTRLVAERFAGAVEIAMGHLQEPQANATTARTGASEFTVFVSGLASRANINRFCQALMESLSQTLDWNGAKLALSPCCGVALAPRDGQDADTVIRHARMALNEARPSLARAKMFTRSLDKKALARLTMERDMRAALDSGEFRAYFQPKVNPINGRIEAAEALARWVRADGSIVNPGRFIPVAEESGLIEALSDAIMREACWKAAAWSRAGHQVHVAVNVSSLQFRNDKFPDHVMQIIDHAGLNPRLLELELTETVAMENPDRARRLIEPLREAGVRFAIDDFGCGHSSLSALSKLPFDVIKIDQQFIRDIGVEGSHSIAIIEMILALAKTMNLDVVAEGVERRDQCEFVASRGCRWIQGFLYGAAVSPLEFGEVLDAQARIDVQKRALANLAERVSSAAASGAA